MSTITWVKRAINSAKDQESAERNEERREVDASVPWCKMVEIDHHASNPAHAEDAKCSASE